MKKLKLLLNHGNIENEINDRLQELKTLTAFGYGKKVAAEIGECVAKIHSCDFAQSKLPLYDVRWVMDLVCEHQTCEFKDDIIAALEFMSKAECYHPMGTVDLEGKHFMAWDIDESRWQNEYGSGHIGRFMWDMAAIISHANDPSFSDAFLEGYIHHGGKVPTLLSLYANIYYVQVAGAARANDFESVKQSTKEITEQRIFKTELISDETLSRLGMDVC